MEPHSHAYYHHMLAHWEQVKEDAQKQYEYALRQYQRCQQALAELALKGE